MASELGNAFGVCRHIHKSSWYVVASNVASYAPTSRALTECIRGSVGEQRGIGHLADRPQILDGVGDVGGVPVDDRGDDQVQSGRAILQRLVGPVDDPPLAERADRLRQDVPLLALVQPGLAAPAKIGIWKMLTVGFEEISAIAAIHLHLAWRR